MGWMEYDPISEAGVGARVSFRVEGGGYRLSTSASPNPALGAARGAGFRADGYTDFCIAVDVPRFDDGAAEQAFGILARVTDLGLGATDGYVLTYQPRDNDIQISRVDDEVPSDVSAFEALSQAPPAAGLRLVFIGLGDQLIGRAYDPDDPTVVLAEARGEDSTFPAGIAGVLIFDNTSGENGTADATFDNYFARGGVGVPGRVEFELEGGDEPRLRWLFPFLAHDVERSTGLDPWVVSSAPDGSVRYDSPGFVYETVVRGGATTAEFFRLREREP